MSDCKETPRPLKVGNLTLDITPEEYQQMSRTRARIELLAAERRAKRAEAQRWAALTLEQRNEELLQQLLFKRNKSERHSL